MPSLSQFCVAAASSAPALEAHIAAQSSNSEVVYVTATDVANPTSGDASAPVNPVNTTNYIATPTQKFKCVKWSRRRDQWKLEQSAFW